MMKDPAEPDTGQEGAHEGAPTAAQMSIYDLYSPRRRNMIIFTAALGFLLSFCTSIYFPALKVHLFTGATVSAIPALLLPPKHLHAACLLHIGTDAVLIEYSV